MIGLSEHVLSLYAFTDPSLSLPTPYIVTRYYIGKWNFPNKEQPHYYAPVSLHDKSAQSISAWILLIFTALSYLLRGIR